MQVFYFRKIINGGQIYLQLRFYRADSNNNCYEGLMIRISSNNTVIEQIDNFDKVRFNYFESNFERIDSSDFIEIQEINVLNKNRRAVYSEFYNEWRKYFQLKKESIESVRSSSPKNDWDYYDRLEEAYILKGVYEQRKKLMDLNKEIEGRNILSEVDIFREARHNATIDYTINKI